LNQIAKGSAVEFQVAGQCGLGVLDAARAKGIFGVGVDADQGYLGSHVMTSALKKVDVAVLAAIKSAKAGKLAAGKNVVFDAKVNGVGYGKWSAKTPASIRAAVAAQFKLLKAGKIKESPPPSSRFLCGMWFRRGGPLRPAPSMLRVMRMIRLSSRLLSPVPACSSRAAHVATRLQSGNDDTWSGSESLATRRRRDRRGRRARDTDQVAGDALVVVCAGSRRCDGRGCSDCPTSHFALVGASSSRHRRPNPSTRAGQSRVAMLGGVADASSRQSRADRTRVAWVARRSAGSPEIARGRRMFGQHHDPARVVGERPAACKGKRSARSTRRRRSHTDGSPAPKRRSHRASENRVRLRMSDFELPEVAADAVVRDAGRHTRSEEDIVFVLRAGQWAYATSSRESHWTLPRAPARQPSSWRMDTALRAHARAMAEALPRAPGSPRLWSPRTTKSTSTPRRSPRAPRRERRGKSTLMNILYGLYTPDEDRSTAREPRGSARRRPDRARHRHGTSTSADPVMTVAENIVLAGELPRGRAADCSVARKRVRELSERYGPSSTPTHAFRHHRRQQRARIRRLPGRGDPHPRRTDRGAAPQEAKELFGDPALAEVAGEVDHLISKLNEVLEIADRITTSGAASSSTIRPPERPRRALRA
jgi:hypothetical protein